MRRAFKYFVVLTILAFMLALAINAEIISGYCGGEGDGTNLTWSLDTETGELEISGEGKMQDWYNSSSVPWYNYRVDVKKVTLGEGVTSIGDYAFCDCDVLESVEMPSVTSIGDYAFTNCVALTSVEMPSVISIGDYAFYCCLSLISVYMPSVMSIGQESFALCVYLESVEIPASVTSIGGAAFCYCYAITSITVDEANEVYSSDEYGVLFNEDKTTLIFYPIGNSRTEYTVPNSVMEISDMAFMYSSTLASVNMSSVTGIGDFAFCGCSALESVKMPSVIAIGSVAFRDCDVLESVEMPSVMSIGSEAFSNCDALTSVEIPASATSIGYYAFRDCHNLKKATIYSKTATFGINVFGGTHADFEIHGYRGSAAETYANANNHSFVAICEEHDYELSDSLSTPPNCFDGGIEVEICTVCGSRKETPVEELGHDFSVEVENVPADCENGGHIIMKCLRCPETDTENFGKIGHDEIPYVAKKPSCTEIGWEAYVACSRCDYSTYEEISAVGHDWLKTGRVSDGWLYECSVCYDTKVTPFDFIPGDADGNGEITIRDAAFILQQIAGWDIEIDLDAADADGNGEITIRDAALILQYIAGWDVTLG